MSLDKKTGVVVHDGPFHADEIIACVQLFYAGLIKKNEIHRSRDPEVFAKYQFVVDVGAVYDEKNCMFDHHQSSYMGELSSAGMVAKFLLHKGFYDPSLYKYLLLELINHVDAFDNGRVSREVLNTPTFSHVIENFVPVQEGASKEEMNKAFFLAFDFAHGHFIRLIQRYEYRQRCKEVVKKAMDDPGEILVFDEMVPWLENFFELGGEKHSAKYIVMPVPNGWKLRVIPKTYEERMGARLDLPKHWGGLSDHEFETNCGIRGGKFCHKGLFIAIFSTKEGAIEGAKKSLNYHLHQK
ncbi:MAG: MYG1 family protein [Chlamydiae bacterium]|nr:MYG1 family protein [Chlamydiota bacterium]